MFISHCSIEWFVVNIEMSVAVAVHERSERSLIDCWHCELCGCNGFHLEIHSSEEGHSNKIEFLRKNLTIRLQPRQSTCVMCTLICPCWHLTCDIWPVSFEFFQVAHNQDFTSFSPSLKNNNKMAAASSHCINNSSFTLCLPNCSATNPYCVHSFPPFSKLSPNQIVTGFV